MVKKLLILALVIVGAFFAFAPHSVHESLGLTASHAYHVSFGVILFAVSGFLYMKMGKKPAAPRQ